MGVLTPLAVVLISALFCVLPGTPLRTAGAVGLAAVAPGWCLWVLADPAFWRRRLDLRLALAVVGSCAVTPLTLYWACYGHDFSALQVGGALVLLCLLLLGLAAGLRRGAEAPPGDPPPEAPAPSDSLRTRLALAGVTVVFAGLVLLPWTTNGREQPGMVSVSPCAADWCFHRNWTYAVLNTGIPPRNPLLGYRGLAYYYGHFVEAASLVRLSGGGLGVNGALALLAALLALATPLLLFHLLRACAATARLALAATAATVLVGGLDLLLLGAEAQAGRPAWWDSGHAAVWACNPRVAFPFDNLQWGQQHHAGALLALALAWYLAATAATLPRSRRVILVGLLLGGVLVNSLYLGLVALLALFLLYALPQWRGVWGPSLPRATAAAGLAVLLGLALASGMLREMRQMAPSEQSRVIPAWPSDALLVTSLVEIWQLQQGVLPASAGGGGGPDFGRLRWKLAATGAAWLGLPVQFGLVGILGVLGLVRRRGWQLLPPPVLALLLAAAFCCLMLGNFDLQLRSAATLWLLLNFGVALYWGAPDTRRRLPARLLVAAACLLGLADVAFDVEGMSRPVYFDAGDVAVMDWVRDHTPPRAVVQGFPGTAPRITAMPRPRFFAQATYTEFTGRCAVVGEHPGMLFPEDESLLNAQVRGLGEAFTASGPAEAARRFHALGVGYVLWLSQDELAPWAPVKSNLLDPQYFAPLDRSGASFVVKVR